MAPRVAGEPDGLADQLRNRPALTLQVSLDLQLVGNVDGQVCNCSSVLPELRASAGFDDHPDRRSALLPIPQQLPWRQAYRATRHNISASHVQRSLKHYQGVE